MQTRTFFRRYALPIIIAAVVSIPLVFIGARGAMRDMNNNVRQWLPEGFKETQDYDWFLTNFGSEEMAVVSWLGCTIDDQRLDDIAEGLQPYVLPEGASADDQRYLFKRVVTSRDMLAQLTSSLGLSRNAALERIKGSLVGEDGKTAAMVVMVSQAGENDRPAALDAIYRVAEAKAGLTPEDLRLGGPTVDSVALSQESSISRYTLAGLAVVIALVLAWRCLKKPNLVFSVFATALLCAGFSVAAVYFTGGEMNLVMTTMPTLIYVLAISGAIHLTNYYKDAVAEHGHYGAAERAVKAGLFPCSLTAGTTAVGLASLGVSDVIPVKMFGLYSALGVLLSLPVLLLFLPAIWSIWPLKVGESKTNKQDGIVTLRNTKRSWCDRLSLTVSRFHGWILAGGLLLMVAMGIGIFQLQTSVKLMNFFSPQAKIIHDYQWLEENLGPLVPVELVARIAAEENMSAADRAMMVQDVQRELESMEQVGGTISVATFTPRIPADSGFRSIAKRAEIAERMSQNREQLVATQYLQDTEAGELWRVSARVEALNSLDYGEFIAELENRVEPVVDKYRNTYGADIEVVYTGVVPLVYKAQNELLSDLSYSFVTAFLLIGGVMIVMLRGFPAGLLTMVPNIFPAVLIFGVMAWTGTLCDIGSMMTASVALGIAVDDTIHYLTWFNRGIEKGYSPRKAVKMANRHCAKAMLQTTLICGVGLLAFGLSSFVPTSRFATLMFAMLVAALIADLILLPAMLSGPLGRLFIKRRRKPRRLAPVLVPVAQQSLA